MRKTLSDKGVRALKPRPTRFAFPDPEMAGHYVRVTPNGAKSYVAVTAAANGKQTWVTIGKAGVLTIVEARERAREAVKRVRAGLPAFEVPPDAPLTFRQVAQGWLDRKVRPEKFRTERQIVWMLDKHILPRWGERAFVGIRRSDITALMDVIDDDHGPRMADAVLGVVRSIMTWHAARVDDYAPPLVRGMRHKSAESRARTRVLDDDELRALWAATEGAGTFGAILRLCLLTGQRSRKVAAMKWADISADGEWTIRS
jgi:hypothetical protein